MGDKGGSKDKGKKEKRKKAKLSPKEKRKAQKAKKNKERCAVDPNKPFVLMKNKTGAAPVSPNWTGACFF